MKSKKIKNQIGNQIEKNKKPLIIAGICAGATAIAAGLIKGIGGIKTSAKAQHEVDKAEYAAAKAEAKANLAEAKAKSNINTHQVVICKGWFLPPNTYDCGSFVVN